MLRILITVACVFACQPADAQIMKIRSVYGVVIGDTNASFKYTLIHDAKSKGYTFPYWLSTDFPGIQMKPIDWEASKLPIPKPCIDHKNVGDVWGYLMINKYTNKVVGVGIQYQGNADYAKIGDEMRTAVFSKCADADEAPIAVRSYNGIQKFKNVVGHTEDGLRMRFTDSHGPANNQILRLEYMDPQLVLEAQKSSVKESGF